MLYVFSVNLNKCRTIIVNQGGSENPSMEIVFKINSIHPENLQIRFNLGLKQAQN